MKAGRKPSKSDPGLISTFHSMFTAWITIAHYLNITYDSAHIEVKDALKESSNVSRQSATVKRGQGYY